MKCLLMIYNQRIELAGRFQIWMWINWGRDLIKQLLNQLSKTVVHQQLYWFNCIWKLKMLRDTNTQLVR